MAAEALDVDIEKVRVEAMDTAITGSSGSCFTYVGGDWVIPAGSGGAVTLNRHNPINIKAAR